MSKLFIKQDKDSSGVRIACRLVTDDDPQIQLIPDEWVKVSTCDPGDHVLRVGAILGQGFKDVKLSLKGGKHAGKAHIKDRYFAPTDGSIYEIVVE